MQGPPQAPAGPDGPGGSVVFGIPTRLPQVPSIDNVRIAAGDDSALVSFDPVAGAKDYRIFELPSDSDIDVAADSSVTVRNALYRCAGNRYGPPVPQDDEPQVQSGAVKTYVVHDVNGFRRTLADATLGHVFVSPGDGRVPVYAMGDPSPDADNSCYFHRWQASRVKKYVASESERTQLLAARWRDDGIAFYAPAAVGPDKVPVYTATAANARYYLIDGPEKDARGLATAVAFQALSAPVDGTAPLMRVFYSNGCGRSHDELVAGQERFQRVRAQGAQPVTSVTFTPLSQEKTLVVEALDRLCPYPGFLSAAPFPAYGPYERLFTLDELRASSDTGEVYVNGQGEATGRPKAIARSFIKVGPRAHEPMDWFADFKAGSRLAPLTSVSTGGEQRRYHGVSGDYDLNFYSVDLNTVNRQLMWALAPVSGELLVNYADYAADTDGKLRLTPTVKGQLASNRYLRATMEVDLTSSTRRYPQMLISNVDAPVQDNLPNGVTLIVQTFGTWPIELQVQVCDHRTWNVNNQCPKFDLHTVAGGLAPALELGEYAGLAERMRFDVYASTGKVYVFFGGQPYGCAVLPTSLVAGANTVTFGDVLYHSGADLDDPWYSFLLRHLHIQTRRHFDNLGFSSGVAQPSWDSSRFPCATQLIP